ncbi:MAG: M48 family metallopeptidase [Planctomycetales bacterium]|nr:M48 family metallopeptidase [Planctomycetales bacterium]
MSQDPQIDGMGSRYRPRTEPIAVFGRGRILLIAATATMALIAYARNRPQSTPGASELANRVEITPQQEELLGQRVTPVLASQFGGKLPDPAITQRIDQITRRLATQTSASQLPFAFGVHVLADRETVNMYPLPGGQICLTTGLLDRLNSDGEIAAVLSQAMGHIARRHGLRQLWNSQLLPGVTGREVLAEINPLDRNSLETARMQQLIRQTTQLTYGEQEIREADQLAVGFLIQAGYDPESLIRALESLSETRNNGIQRVAYFDSHPTTVSRIESIRQEIARQLPGGIPANLMR